MTDDRFEPWIYLIGAGPGNVSLLTVRALECLARADLVLYDRLVSTDALAYAPQAEHRCVDEFPGDFTRRRPHVCRAMIDAAKQGRRVARLKGGDPTIFGRLGEEAESIAAAGVSFEIVPGVTAAVGAAAYAGFPLTHRHHASAVAFVTGHEDPLKPSTLLDWDALARFPGTLVFYMGIKRLEEIVAALLSNGKSATTPTALVHRATQGRQRTVEAPLGELSRIAKEAKLPPPTLLIVGSVLEARARLNWFERRPLFGKRVLITRPARQSRDVLRRLERLGAVAFSLPTVEIEAPADSSGLDDALARISSYHWIVFTSVNGVDYFMRRLRQSGRDLRALGHVKLATIGPSTADALRSYHLEPDVVPAVYRSEALASALIDLVRGRRVLLARANRGRELLQEALAEVAEVEQVTAYDQRDVSAIPADLHDALRAGEFDYVTLTAPNVARSLARLLDEEAQAQIRTGRVKLVSISPVTSAAVVDELNWPIAAEASEHTLDGVLEAMIAHAAAASAEEGI